MRIDNFKFDKTKEMSSTELKEQLISQIQVTDHEISGGLLRLLAIELNNSEPLKLNEFPKEFIAICKQKFLNGEVYTEEEADK